MSTEKTYDVTIRLCNNQRLQLKSVGSSPSEALKMLLRANGAGSLNSIELYKLSGDSNTGQPLHQSSCYADVVSKDSRGLRHNYYYAVTPQANLIGGSSWSSLT